MMTSTKSRFSFDLSWKKFLGHYRLTLLRFTTRRCFRQSQSKLPHPLNLIAQFRRFPKSRLSLVGWVMPTYKASVSTESSVIRDQFKEMFDVVISE